MINLGDALNISYVPRWTIVPMLREQSVSDHTYRVMVIYLRLCVEFGETPNLMRVLLHDAPEARTGDIPSPVKAHIKAQWPALDTYGAPWLTPGEDPVLKLADLIEAFTWLKLWGNPATAIYRWSEEDLLRKLHEHTEDPNVKTLIDGIIDEIIAGMTSA